MATETPSAGDRYKIFTEEEWHELIIVMHDSNPTVAAPAMAELAALTLGQWLRAWRAIKRGIAFEGALIPEKQLLIPARENGEARVSIHNHTFTGLSITVHSHSDGTGALEMAQGQKALRELMLSKMPQLFVSKPIPPQVPQNSPKQPDLNDIDAFLASDEAEQSGHGTLPDTSGDSLPFRMFKSLSDTIIQVQEFKQGGGGDKYQKSAVKASLPFHKTTVQYEDDSLIYYPITGAITIVEGQYGTQAVIPTANGRVYVSKENKSGEETPDWHNFAQDLHDNYALLADGTISQFFAPNCVLVMKTGKQKDSTQYKNYFHIYQSFVKK